MQNRRGFTLIEILVTIGIVVLLIGVTLPAVNKARSSAARSRIAADMQAIATGMTAYHADFHAYPAVGAGDVGWRVLAIAMAGRENAGVDGHNGDGFKTIAAQAGPDGVFGTSDDIESGPVRGPYIAVDKFRFLKPPAPPATITALGIMPTEYDESVVEGAGYAFTPMLYYVARSSKPRLGDAAGGYVTSTANSLYDHRQNDADPLNTRKLAIADMQRMMGDRDNSGTIGTNEKPATESPFILWAAGRDGRYGTKDDVTNFTFSPD